MMVTCWLGLWLGSTFVVGAPPATSLEVVPVVNPATPASAKPAVEELVGPPALEVPAEAEPDATERLPAPVPAAVVVKDVEQTPWQRQSIRATGVEIVGDSCRQRSFPEPQRRWRHIQHTVLPGETAEEIAARYGTKKASLRRSNDGKLKLVPGKSIKVYASRTPAPRRRIEHVSADGEDWTAVATKYKVRYRELRAWNRGVGSTLGPGRTLVVYIDDDRPQTVNAVRGPAVPEIRVRDGAISTGRPQRGKITNAVRLPESTLYTLKVPQHAYGSSHAIRTHLEAIAQFRYASGYDGQLIIGGLSRRRGRTFKPHKSHQSGRDIDIFLPILPHVAFTYSPNPHEVDWEASFELARAFAATGRTEAIYLDRKVQRFLYEAGRNMGVSLEELDRLIEFPPRPGKDPSASAVRHSADHVRHFHIRIECADNEPDCYNERWDERHTEIMKRKRLADKEREAKKKRRSRRRNR